MAGQTDNTDILNGLNQLIQAVNDLVLSSNCSPQIVNNVSMSCQCGSGGAGGTDTEPSDTDTGDPGDPQGDPPDGFDTWEEYHTYKCGVATKIIDDLLADFNWYLGLAPEVRIALAVGSFAIGMLTPIPGDEVAVVMGILLAILQFDITIVTWITNSITNNYDDLVCTLFSATNATQAEANVEQALADAVDDEFSSWPDPFVPWQVKELLSLMVSTYSINRLFVKDEALNGKLPTGDCSECASEECAVGPYNSTPDFSSSWAGDQVTVEFGSYYVGGNTPYVGGAVRITACIYRVVSYSLLSGTWNGSVQAPTAYGHFVLVPTSFPTFTTQEALVRSSCDVAGFMLYSKAPFTMRVVLERCG